MFISPVVTGLYESCQQNAPKIFLPDFVYGFTKTNQFDQANYHWWSFFPIQLCYNWRHEDDSYDHTYMTAKSERLYMSTCGITWLEKCVNIKLQWKM